MGNHQIALRIFVKCTLHKLPHLLESEFVYRFTESSFNGWADWNDPLFLGISSILESFLSRLAQRSSIPHSALLIVFVTIAQCDLGLMDPSTRAVQDFVLTMSQATR